MIPQIGRSSIGARLGLMAVALLMILSPLFFSNFSYGKVPSGPHVVLITIDALRADHLSCYGYERKTSPFIDSIAKQGTLFSNAYSTSSWTPPSMASIFTARYPRGHGVLHSVIKKNKIIFNQEKLSSHFWTLPELLKMAGYRTFGISGNPHVSEDTGFGQGFDYYVTLWFKDAPTINKVVRQFKEKIQRSSKCFLFIHYFDPHDPYHAREPWISKYNPDKKAYKKWAGKIMREMVKYRRELKAENRNDYGTRRTLIDLYDSEINYCDYHFQDLIESLSLKDNSIIVISADHGEEFLEHSRMGHGWSLYEEVVRVPLIVKLPPDTPVKKTVDQPVSNKDIFPTILEAVGIDIPAQVKGRSLIHLMKDHSRETPESIYMELDRRKRKKRLKAIRRDKWKLICRGQSLERTYLFDLHDDPLESENLSAFQPDVVQRMKNDLNEWMDAHPAFKAPKTDRILKKNLLKKLRALGYLQ